MNIIRVTNPKGLSFLGSIVSVTILLTLTSGAKDSPKFAAHEWGTFTSVQGGNGSLLAWRPLESSHLPGFVYDWRNPGLGRRATSPLLLGKGAMTSLQRMETPVIYFYTENPMTVDVSVRFPQGSITEWYPQATQIGPASVAPSPVVAQLDRLAHEVGAGPNFTFTSLGNNQALKDSRVHWADVQLLPHKADAQMASQLPGDQSGIHYFAARETESDLVQIKASSPTNSNIEREKFLFYRGVGNFTTPLQVTMDGDKTLTMANVGKESLTHLFVLGLHQGLGEFIELKRLAPGEQRTVQLDAKGRSRSVPEVSQQLGEQMASALASEGLYPREAAAMVKTWKDTWFEEDGVRVLYILSRSWTDRTLPLEIKPQPRELVRVMVGRAEVIAPGVEQELIGDLTKAGEGDQVARNRVLAELQKLGRFAQPALDLATREVTPQLREKGWELFQAAFHPAALAKTASANWD